MITIADLLWSIDLLSNLFKEIKLNILSNTFAIPDVKRTKQTQREQISKGGLELKHKHCKMYVGTCYYRI